MEAVALYDFTASAVDELSFKRGNVLKVISFDSDKNWYKATLDGLVGFIPSNYIELQDTSWFHGRITRRESEDLLLKRLANGHQQTDGAFIIRHSESNPDDFSLSLKYNAEIQHFKILYDREEHSYYIWSERFASLNKLIEYYRTKSISRTDQIFLKNILSTNDVISSTNSQRTTNGVQSSGGQLRNNPRNNDPNERICVAMYDYNPQNADDLRLKTGDRIRILDKMDDNWCRGECQGRIGLFPINYVK
ncbi:hypothetical protein SNEBB_001691 [Seison nebaliae]|nr:hypothetical protein SNEBB_001691 [Seison nebaliae]